MTADDGKLDGLTTLGRAWLDELNLLHRLKDDATEDERRELIAKANEAGEEVETRFEALRQSGGLQDVTAAYKQYRADAKAKGAKAVAWPVYAHDRKACMVRALARETAFRNRWIIQGSPAPAADR